MKKPSTPRTMAVYTGRRLWGGTLFGGKQTVVHQFITKTGKELHFSGTRGIRMGATYLIFSNAAPIRPKRVWDAEDQFNPKWEAEDALVDAHYARQRAEAGVKKLNRASLNRAMEALIPLVRDLGHYETKQLIEHLVGQLKSKKRTKGPSS